MKLRQRNKPIQRFSPEEEEVRHKAGFAQLSRKRKEARMNASWNSYRNPWKKYLSELDSLLDGGLRGSSPNSCCQVYDKICEIISQIYNINKDDVRYGVLRGSSGVVDLSNIDCSKCGLPDEPNNDIMICDGVECLRAYHTNCLRPRISPDTISTDPNDDWFCHECVTLASCLEKINDFYGTNYSTIFDFQASTMKSNTKNFDAINLSIGALTKNDSNDLETAKKKKFVKELPFQTHQQEKVAINKSKCSDYSQVAIIDFSDADSCRSFPHGVPLHQSNFQPYCEFFGCYEKAFFFYNDDKPGAFCDLHKKTGMVLCDHTTFNVSNKVTDRPNDVLVEMSRKEKSKRRTTVLDNKKTERKPISLSLQIDKTKSRAKVAGAESHSAVLHDDISSLSQNTFRRQSSIWLKTSLSNSVWGRCFRKVYYNVKELENIKYLLDVVYCDNSDTKSLKMTSQIENTRINAQKRKMLVVEAINELRAMNSEHVRNPQLLGNDGDGMVDLTDVYCSKCRLPDSEDNDIYLCDMGGCCRAYHLSCLDPPVDSARVTDNPEEDWFCWQCRVLSDVLLLINDHLECVYENLEEFIQDDTIFSDSTTSMNERNFADEASDDDEIYIPLKKENTQKQSSSSIINDSVDESEESDSSSMTSLTNYDTRGSVGGSTDEFSDGVELDSNISNDELDGLIYEAGDDVELFMQSNDAVPGPSSFTPEQRRRRPSERLRKNAERRLSLQSADGRKRTENGFIDVTDLTPDDILVGVSLATVKHGYICVGKVKAIDTDPITWEVEFEKFPQNVRLDWNEVRVCYQRYSEYDALLKQHGNSKKVTKIEVDEISCSAIIEGKRAIPRLDYAALHEQSFGHIDPENDDEEDDEDFELPASKLLDN